MRQVPQARTGVADRNRRQTGCRQRNGPHPTKALNDLLFSLAGKKKAVRVEALAEALELNSAELAQAVKSRKIRYRLQKDIFFGNKLGISGTPAYVIDGKVYLGQIPAEVLKSGMKD